MRRDAHVCPQCGQQSPAWILRDGYWWASVGHIWYWLDEPNGTWQPAEMSARGMSRRAKLTMGIVVAAVVLLVGGCAGILYYVDHYDAELNTKVTTAMRELPMGSTPADMRRRLGDPQYVVQRTIHGQRAFCMQYTVAVFGDEDLRTACYVRGQRVR